MNYVHGYRCAYYYKIESPDVIVKTSVSMNDIMIHTLDFSMQIKYMHMIININNYHHIYESLFIQKHVHNLKQ